MSNYKLHSSGHRYFTLKDESSQIACTMWRTRPQPVFAVQDGVKVRVFGRVTVWEAGGRYQLDVSNLLPFGIGSLQLAFDVLKQKLSAEGLFDQGRKRRLPAFPERIGIITSPTGAVIHDLAWGFSSRFPCAKLFLWPVPVQGEGAAEKIANAVHRFADVNPVDVLIIARGGGSLEDLWAFNEEAVVRAVAASSVPTVAAIGHEVDYTLTDFAADLRAPTPTGAAALIVPDRRELLPALADRSESLRRSVVRRIVESRRRVDSIASGYGFGRARSRVSDERLRFDDLARKLDRSYNESIGRRRERLMGLTGKMDALSPSAVMRRGFSAVFKPDGSIVRSGSEVSPGERISLRFAAGGAESIVEKSWNG